MELHTVRIERPEDANVIVGQAHFIKTVEDLHEALAGASPQLRFGVAFCESSGPRLVRHSGNDAALVEVATRNALAIGAGHAFVVVLRLGFPVNVLNALNHPVWSTGPIPAAGGPGLNFINDANITSTTFGQVAQPLNSARRVIIRAEVQF